ncbi:Trm112 family protein [uncultured Sutterella sp.]|uniref:Trm112 family protein n=1 Tax=uncultured Sutterella sp. TaxID=286133 RepID=UPI00263343CF|nr:Trm112 family protein [uncultured Sutterella sp.]
MTQRIPEFLVCPVCKGKLIAGKSEAAASPEELLCPACALAFPIQDGIPMMLAQDARKLSDEEAAKVKLEAERLSGKAPRPGQF